MEKQTVYREILPAYVTYWVIEQGSKRYVRGCWASEQVEDGLATMVDARE